MKLIILSFTFLLGQSPDLNQKLIEAAWAGDDLKVKNLLHAGADIEAMSEMGWPNDFMRNKPSTTYYGGTAIIWAACAGNSSTVRILAEAGANVNKKDSQEMTALMWAARRGRTETVRALLEVGADVDMKSSFGSTVLMDAVPFPAIVGLLVEHGADVNATRWGLGERTALMGAVSLGEIETVRILLRVGANPNLPGGGSLHGRGRWNDDNITPLIMASWKGSLELVEILLDAGANIDATDEAGYTALTWAKLEGHTSIVDLIEKRMQ